MVWFTPIAIVTALTAVLVSGIWLLRRGRPRKGLQWSDNSPVKTSRTLGR